MSEFAIQVNNSIDSPQDLRLVHGEPEPAEFSDEQLVDGFLDYLTAKSDRTVSARILELLGEHEEDTADEQNSAWREEYRRVKLAVDILDLNEVKTDAYNNALEMLLIGSKSNPGDVADVRRAILALREVRGAVFHREALVDLEPDPRWQLIHRALQAELQ